MLGRRKEAIAEPPLPAAAPPERPFSPTELRTAPAAPVHKRLGDLLLDEHLITADQLSAAIAIQKEKGGFLGQILVQEGFVTQNQVASCLVKQCKIPHLSLMDYDIGNEVLALIPQELCRKYRLLPIDKLGRILTVAMVDPLDLEALEQIRAACPELRIKPILCNWEHFQNVYLKVYGREKGADGQQVMTASSLGLSEAPRKAVETRTEPVPAPSAVPAAAAAPAPSAAPAPAAARPLEDSSLNLRATLDDALNQALTAIKEQQSAAQPAVPVPAAISTEDISTVMRESVLEVLEFAQRQQAAQAAPAAPAFSPEDIAAAVREGMRELMQAAPQTAPAAEGAGPSPDQLAQAMRDSLREVLEGNQQHQQSQETRLSQIAEAILQSVQENHRLIENKVVEDGVQHDIGVPKNRHASVVPFQRWKAGETTTVEDSSIHRDEDSRIMEALYGEHPLETLTFDNFFPGKANAFTHKLSQAVAAHPGVDYNPFFLYGHVGIGKTHLISAMGNAILTANPQHRVGYVSASHFSKRVMEAAREGALDVFRENYSHWDVLILDDIQFLGGRVDAQEEFFHIFNVLYHQSRQVIIASDKAPDRLGLLEQRLVSRFASGIVAELKAPEWETRMQILRHQLGQFSVPQSLPDEVISMIAMRVPDDVRKMTGALRKVMAYAKLVGQDISLEMASEILKHLQRKDEE